MRAIVYDRYGGPDQLRAVDLPTPAPRAGEVLVEVVATSVNLSDWEGLTGSPAYARFGGLRRPLRKVLGSDIAGRIVSLGDGVTGFQVGDEVYGDNLQLLGGFAQFARMPASMLARKPRELTFAEVSALPQAGSIAQQGLAGVRNGQRVLINGAGGGTGSFAIPIAKRAGAHVTGVDNAGKLEFMRSLGADEVIDYRVTDPTRSGTYDLVLDLVARRSVFAYRRMLAPGGRYLCVGGTARSLLRVLTIGNMVARMTGRRMSVLVVRTRPTQLAEVAALCVSGGIGIHIDRTYSLEQTAEAVARVGEGQALGKVIVEVASAG